MTPEVSKTLPELGQRRWARGLTGAWLAELGQQAYRSLATGSEPEAFTGAWLPALGQRAYRSLATGAGPEGLPELGYRSWASGLARAWLPELGQRAYRSLHLLRASRKC